MKSSSAQDLMITSEVETAVSMLQTISSEHSKSELMLEQAKQLGADLLRGLRMVRTSSSWATSFNHGRLYTENLYATGSA